MTIPEFGALIRQLREERNIGLREVARRVGISAGYLSQVERGQVPSPSEDVIIKLADCLCVDVIDLTLDAGRLPKRFVEALMSDRPMTSILIRAILQMDGWRHVISAKPDKATVEAILITKGDIIGAACDRARARRGN